MFRLVYLFLISGHIVFMIKCRWWRSYCHDEPWIVFQKFTWLCWFTIALVVWMLIPCHYKMLVECWSVDVGWWTWICPDVSKLPNLPRFCMNLGLVVTSWCLYEFLLPCWLWFIAFEIRVVMLKMMNGMLFSQTLGYMNIFVAQNFQMTMPCCIRNPAAVSKLYAHVQKIHIIGVCLCLVYGYFEYYMNIVVACTITMLLLCWSNFMLEIPWTCCQCPVVLNPKGLCIKLRFLPIHWLEYCFIG